MNKVEAADFLGISTRTLERRAEEWRLTVKLIRCGRTVRSYYDEQELDRVKSSLNELSRGRRPRHGKQNESSDLTQLPVILAYAIAAARLIPEPPPKLFLSLPEAAALSSIPVAKLRSDAKCGALKTIKSIGRGLGKVRRDDLERYIKQLD